MPLLLSESAKPDVSDACKWSDSESTGLENRFLKELSVSFEKIQHYPKGFQKPDSKKKKFILQIFPFNIIHMSYEKEILIFAVFHTSKKIS
jgi:plasmid stabilization system protein ParE